MNVSYIIHKIPKDSFYSLAISIKNSDGILMADKKAQLLPQDKKIAEALIKDFNAHKSLKVSSLEYGKFDKIPVSDKQTTFFLTELAKVRDVSFESKKVVIDPLSFSKLFYDVSLTDEQADINAYIIDGIYKMTLHDIEVFLGQHNVWLLHKGVLKRLKQEFKWLKIAQDQEVLTGKKREDLIDHYENELPISQDVPEAKFHVVKAKKITPTPYIELKNDRGLFFDLKFEYADKGCFYISEAPSSILNKDDESFWEKALCDHGVKKNGKEYYVSSPDQEKIFKELIKDGFSIKHVNGKSVVIIENISATVEEHLNEYEFEISISHTDVKAEIDDVLSSVLRKTPLVSIGKQFLGLIPLSVLGDLEVIFRGRKKDSKIIFEPRLKGDFLLKSLNVIDKTEIELANVKFDHFNLTLLDFQKKGVAWLLSNLKKGFSCLLADDMGLGKTVQVLALIDLMKTNLPKGVLVICPKSIKAQWRSHVIKILSSINVQIDILSFHELRASKDELSYSLTVIDEAQAIKNANTMLFQKCCQVNSDYKIAMSGTPVENSLKDLVTIFDFLSPTLVEEFKGMNVTLGHHKINRRLAPFIKRRLKQDVLSELPELFEQECIIEMGESQAETYFGLIKDAKTKPVHAFSLITKLRLAALDERLVDPSIQDMSSKTWQVLEDVDQIVRSNQKVIIFSQFTSYLALIKKHIEQLGYEYAYLDGNTQNREEVVRDFFGDKNILLMSLKAGGVGLNLQVADYILLLDPWWNEAVENQAIARAYRLGRQKPVVAKRYLTQGTLETKIKELKASKIALLNELETNAQDLDTELLDLIASLD